MPDPRYRYKYLRSNSDWGEISAEDDSLALPVLDGSVECPALMLLPCQRCPTCGEVSELKQPVDVAAGCGPLPNLLAMAGHTKGVRGRGRSAARFASRPHLDEFGLPGSGVGTCQNLDCPRCLGYSGGSSSSGSTVVAESDTGSVAGEPARLQGSAAILAFHLAARPKHLGRKRPRRIPSDFKDPWAYTAHVARTGGVTNASRAAGETTPKPIAPGGSDQKMDTAGEKDLSFGLPKRELLSATMRDLWHLATAKEREVQFKARKEARKRARTEGKADNTSEDAAYDGDDDSSANDDIFDVVVLNPSTDNVLGTATGAAAGIDERKGDGKVVTADGGEATAVPSAEQAATATTAAAAAGPAPLEATSTTAATIGTGMETAIGAFVPAPPVSGRDDYEIATTNSDEELEIGAMGLRAIPSDAIPADEGMGTHGGDAVGTRLKRPYDAFAVSADGTSARNEKALEAQRLLWRRQVRDFNRRQLRDDHGELVLQGFDRSDGDIPVAVYLSSTRAGIRKVWGHCDGIGNGLAYRRRYYYGLNPDGADYDVADDYSDPEDAFGLDQAVVSATEPALQEEQARVLQARMQQQVSLFIVILEGVFCKCERKRKENKTYVTPIGTTTSAAGAASTAAGDAPVVATATSTGAASPVARAATATCKSSSPPATAAATTTPSTATSCAAAAAAAATSTPLASGTAASTAARTATSGAHAANPAD